jgi:very-short-patch-repair endonuclease
MSHLPAAVHTLFAQQHGMVSTAQLLEAGLSIHQIARLEAGGTITSFVRGVYRTPSHALDELARCAGVCLGRPKVCIAGPTAGRLWGFRRLPDDRRVHILAPPASKPIAATWVRPYRTAAIRDADVEERSDGVRVTTRARTALDLARTLAPPDLLSVIEQAMHDGGLGVTDMYAVAAEWESPARPWVRTFLRTVSTRIPGGAAESHGEVRLASALRSAGVGGLVRQLPVTLPNYGRARFDLAVPAVMWAIELDLFPTHRETAGARRDAARDAAARAAGWTLSRVTADDYTQRFDETVRALVDRYENIRRARVPSPA